MQIVLRQPDDSSWRPSGAYVHVPFCNRRCGYCNFTLIAGRDDLVEPYLHCLEIELQRLLGTPQPVKTLFIGGGTPTFLPPSHLEHLLDLIRRWLPLEEGGEYSCEANPIDCDSERLRVLRAGGVNRLSLGGQSFNDQKLVLLERDHTGRDLRRSIDLASKFFENLSLDLIFAAPGESLSDWRNDLVSAMELPVRHLSTYGLTVEKGTTFFNRMIKGDLVELDADLQLEMYHATIDMLSAAGWKHYEVSNFSNDGFQCRHNIGYWNGQSWWAFGPGAASCLPKAFLPDGFLATLASSQNDSFLRDSATSLHGSAGQLRPEDGCWALATNHRSTTQYIKRIRRGESPIAELEWLDLEQWIRQRFVFGLRQSQGIDLTELSALWGGPVEPLFEPYLGRYIQQGWLELVGQRLRLTRQGLVISDGLWPDLLVSEKAAES